ncbi:MAG TPA: TetR/AcrR family transcriptional regulator [Candidatus Dormibacteraeota bacterium]|jgi:AcrR family transcriptional regulator
MLAAPSWIPTDELPTTAKGQRTRQRILKAAEVLFNNQGYNSVGVNEIVEKAGVSIGTFYRYFEHREHLFVVLLGEVLWSMYRASRGVWQESESFERNFKATSLAYLTAYWENRKLLNAADEIVASSDAVRRMWWGLRRDLYGHMAHRVAEDQARSSLKALDTQLLTRALGAMTDEYARRAFSAEEYGRASRSDVERASDVLGEIWFRSIFGSGTAPTK